MKRSSTKKGAILVLLLQAILAYPTFGASSAGPFAVSVISETNASDCSATDGSFSLTLDAGNLGVSPYDISIDNGATWLVNNQAPVSNVLSVSAIQWGTYPLAVRDANGDVIYPGYAAIEGCSMDVTLETPHVFTTGSVVGATGYTWTTSIGSIISGQGTTSATVDYSSETHLATGTVCVQPTGPTCTAPATCFGIVVNSICYGGADNDNDGISDICDLDDDNDGIPDLVESSCDGSSIVSMGTWDNNLSPYQAGTIWNPSLIASVANEVFGSGLSVTEASTTLIVAGIDQPNFSSAVAANDYIEFALTTQPNINALYLRDFFYTKNDFAGANEYGYSVVLAYSDDNFTTSRIVVSNHTIDTYVNGSQQDIRTLVDDNFASLEANTTYSFRLYFFNKTTPGNARFDDFALSSGQCTIGQDFDGDGISNHLDLDSDNDGILDVDEAGHSAADANDDGVIDGLSAAFGVNGLFDALETSADSDVLNYSIADSESAPDGIYDAYELDSDGDGCLDAREEGVSDADTDGIAGTGVASVTAEGLVNSITYGSPSNSTWQNPSTNNCFYIDGSVFEDINYGGGPGREFGAANVSSQASGWSHLDIGIHDFRVELYSSTGAFLASDLTNVNGIYRFENISPGDYTVRFVTRTAYSNRSSNSTGTREYAVPVYRSIQSAIYANEIGGVDPTREDAPENTTNLNISSLNTATLVAQSVSNISVTTSSVSDLDLGLSFNVVSNANDDGIGSLRQFIINSNELANTNINLEDNPTGRPALEKPAGVDVSIFEIAGSGPHTIEVSSALPRIEDPFTHVSGYTQQGSSQGAISSRAIAIELDGLESGYYPAFNVWTSNVQVSGFSMYDFYYGLTSKLASSEEVFIWGNFIGTLADGLTLSSARSTGIVFDKIDQSYIGTNGDGVNDANEGNVVVNSYGGIVLDESQNILVAGNYIGLAKSLSKNPLR